jgi:hypothetical protein
MNPILPTYHVLDTENAPSRPVLPLTWYERIWTLSCMVRMNICIGLYVAGVLFISLTICFVTVYLLTMVVLVMYALVYMMVDLSLRYLFGVPFPSPTSAPSLANATYIGHGC